ncbi:MAG: TonB-dependent receptor [Acidobacteria bacterium]|nr:TonB-dependent receptor [Acidobacteriota bacterium]
MRSWSLPQIICRVLSVCLLLTPFLLVAPASGQASYTAQIRGVVTDRSGAVVPNATVTITNDATNISATAKTNSEGLYILTGLRPATYTIRADAADFRSLEKKNVVLGVDQQTTIDFSLSPASISTNIEVTESAPLLDTETANLGTDISNQYVRDIPLYNRSVFGLVFLAGGVTETTGSGINDNYPSGTNFVSNGQRNATAEVRLDGSPISAPEQGEGGNSNVYYQPSVEIIQEFKLQNNSFSAEFGNNGGTVMNMVLKQGTNNFHGSGWWYGQRSVFDSRDFFNNGEKPDHSRNQYGFSLGGPIIKNKTFFFLDFERVTQGDPVNIEARVPTALERAGDFSQSGTPIYDPSQCSPSGDSCVRPRFSFDGVDDVMDPASINPIGQAILNLYPEANISGAEFPDPNYRSVLLSSFESWQFDVKVDHQINNQHKIGGRYSRHSDNYSTPTVFANGDMFNDGVIYETKVQNGGLEYSWSPTSNMLWTSRLGIDRVVAPGMTNNYPTLTSVGLPSVLDANGLDRMPAIITGDDPWTSMFSQCCVDTHFAHTLATYSSALQWVHGAHSFKFGGEQRRFYNNFWQPNYPSGLFDFSRDVTTQQPNAGLGDEGQGNAFATILTGFPYSGELNIVPAVADLSKETAFFVMDDWKVTPKLTVNIGLRYEWSTPYTERYNRVQFSDFSGDSGINLPGLGEIKGTTIFANSNRRSVPIDRNNFAPRLGFAYQLAPNTVIRGGAGLFYGMNVATNFQYAGTAFRKSAAIHFTTDNYETQFATLANPFPNGLAGPQGDKYGALAQWGFGNENDLGTETARNAEIYQWNLGVQHLLPGQVLIAADYSANRSTHLPWAGTSSTRNRNFLSSTVRDQLVEEKNPTHDPSNNAVSDYLNNTVANPFQPLFVPGAEQIFDEPDSIYNDAEIPQINLLRPYPQFDGSFAGLPLLAASSWYHSLQVRFQKRTTHYVSFEGNYTWAKATDYSSAGANAWIGNLGADNPQVLDDLAAEHSVGASDTRHRFTTAVIIDLPFGRGRWIGGGMNKTTDAIVGGWSLNSFITLQSGQPLAIGMNSPRLADGNQRPDVICSNLRTGISFTEAAITGAPYLNSDCFADPGDNIAGNAHRFFDNLRGPGIRNLDLSLSKEFNIHEDMKLQIRAEMFNATNTPRFAFPVTGWGSESFGNVNSTTGNYRKMQFGARFQF